MIQFIGVECLVIVNDCLTIEIKRLEKAPMTARSIELMCERLKTINLLANNQSIRQNCLNF
jgi:hypothetical protein